MPVCVCVTEPPYPVSHMQTRVRWVKFEAEEEVYIYIHVISDTFKNYIFEGDTGAFTPKCFSLEIFTDLFVKLILGYVYKTIQCGRCISYVATNASLYYDHG